MALTDASFLLFWLLASGCRASGSSSDPGRSGWPRPRRRPRPVVQVQRLARWDRRGAGRVPGAAARRRRSVSAAGSLAVWGCGLVAAVAAALVYWPWFGFVETHGGYADALASPRGYIGGLSSWFEHWRLQLEQATALSGGLGLELGGCESLPAWRAATRLVPPGRSRRRSLPRGDCAVRLDSSCSRLPRPSRGGSVSPGCSPAGDMARSGERLLHVCLDRALGPHPVLSSLRPALAPAPVASAGSCRRGRRPGAQPRAGTAEARHRAGGSPIAACSFACGRCALARSLQGSRLLRPHPGRAAGGLARPRATRCGRRCAVSRCRADLPTRCRGCGSWPGRR